MAWFWSQFYPIVFEPQVVIHSPVICCQYKGEKSKKSKYQYANYLLQNSETVQLNDHAFFTLYTLCTTFSEPASYTPLLTSERWFFLTMLLYHKVLTPWKCLPLFETTVTMHLLSAQKSDWHVIGNFRLCWILIDYLCQKKLLLKKVVKSINSILAMDANNLLICVDHFKWTVLN